MASTQEKKKKFTFSLFALVILRGIASRLCNNAQAKLINNHFQCLPNMTSCPGEHLYIVVSNSKGAAGCMFLGKLIFLNYQQFTNFTFCLNFLEEASLEPAVQGRDMNLSWLLLELPASFSDRSVQGSTPITSII